MWQVHKNWQTENGFQSTHVWTEQVHLPSTHCHLQDTSSLHLPWILRVLLKSSLLFQHHPSHKYALDFHAGLCWLVSGSETNCCPTLFTRCGGVLLSPHTTHEPLHSIMEWYGWYDLLGGRKILQLQNKLMQKSYKTPWVYSQILEPQNSPGILRLKEKQYALEHACKPKYSHVLCRTLLFGHLFLSFKQQVAFSRCCDV